MPRILFETSHARHERGVPGGVASFRFETHCGPTDFVILSGVVVSEVLPLVGASACMSAPLPVGFHDDAF